MLSTTATRKGGGSEFPTPEFLVVDSYKQDYTYLFSQPPSYIQGHGGGTWFCHCISTLPTYTVSPVNVLEMSHQKGSKVRCMNLSHLYVEAGWKQS